MQNVGFGAAQQAPGGFCTRTRSARVQAMIDHDQGTGHFGISRFRGWPSADMAAISMAAAAAAESRAVVDEPRETFPQDLPEGTIHLSGDFLCAVFKQRRRGMHGWPANSPGMSSAARRQPMACGHLPLAAQQVTRASVDKILTCATTSLSPQEHVFSGGSGAFVAHHPMQ
jgi:hypothetical protein